MIGANGAGKTTLLKKIAEELLNRNDIKAEYMPQTYKQYGKANRTGKKAVINGK